MKERCGLRQLICDGGRTLNALTSLWEQHALLTLPERRGEETLTVVWRPTCMAFDQRRANSVAAFAESWRSPDLLDAGAYHLPWETRFSHGHAAVCWHDEAALRLARERQNLKTFGTSGKPLSGFREKAVNQKSESGALPRRRYTITRRAT
ncbi:MAG: hypothetical protein WDN00_06610 [Limisphaerales bacterium]